MDSETLYNTITSELLTELGFAEYTPEICIDLFAGQAWSMIKATLEEKHGDIIPRDIIERYIKTANAQMDFDLRTPEGASDVLAQLKQERSICVASNGERNNVLKSLRVTGLMEHFVEEQVFTKIQVARPKPAPDLFLFTAEQMGFEPAQCLVIEDSPAGVAAAVAANMPVIGFTGCSHDQERQADLLTDAGANFIIDKLIHIQNHA